MWRGPSQAVKESYSDPITTRLARLCSRAGVHYNMADDGRSAEVFQLRRASDTWARVVIGRVEGTEPAHVALGVARQFTPINADLLALATAWLEREIERVAFVARQEVELCSAIDGLIGALRDRA
jgi:hypothetical protein